MTILKRRAFIIYSFYFFRHFFLYIQLPLAYRCDYILLKYLCVCSRMYVCKRDICVYTHAYCYLWNWIPLLLTTTGMSCFIFLGDAHCLYNINTPVKQFVPFSYSVWGLQPIKVYVALLWQMTGHHLLLHDISQLCLVFYPARLKHKNW